MKKNKNKYIVVNHIKEIMFKKNITSYELSRITNIPRQTITRIIEDKYSNPEIYTSSAIAQALSTTIDNLFELKINPKFLFTKQNLDIINILNKSLKIKGEFYNQVSHFQ